MGKRTAGVWGGYGILPAQVHGLGVLREECVREAGPCSHRTEPVVEHRGKVLGICTKGECFLDGCGRP